MKEEEGRKRKERQRQRAYKSRARAERSVWFAAKLPGTAQAPNTLFTFDERRRGSTLLLSRKIQRDSCRERDRLGRFHFVFSLHTTASTRRKERRGSCEIENWERAEN